MTVTKNLATYIDHLGINLSELSRKTGIPYQTIYHSVGCENPKRDLKADDLAKICLFLNVNPMDFVDRDQQTTKT